MTARSLVVLIASINAAGSTEHAVWAALARIWTESAASAPKLIVSMGEETAAFLGTIGLELADPVDAEALGEIRRLTPTIAVLATPDVDASLDEQAAKTAFWNAFKALGAWWAEQPPY